MKKMIYVMLMFLIVIACNDNKMNIDNAFIKKLSTGDFKIPSRYGNFLLFINSGDSLGYTNINVLHGMYMQNYSHTYINFESFLSDALNQKIVFPHDTLKNNNINVFALNTVTKSEYDQHGISSFVKLYCIEKGGNKFVIKKQYQTTDQLFTILYCFFLNNYQISKDDNIGEFTVSK